MRKGLASFLRSPAQEWITRGNPDAEERDNVTALIKQGDAYEKR
jgi:hypothetical protein